ncbi:aldehyde dehydrogenase [Rhodococcus wratislaviensis]|uniref:aldehyde dehydrogenase (NAD(+)) n=1 Tax=Rhodococcus wratislaviensis NBRC 100605 TaxID=1219028 RepID=X0Q109_RHOWR|nr:aldehyde dehydrogenase [Rhodococcus wratislaviensis]GAF43876.1 putative aldehyde dehydrogenase [Rhodococcus wratislaviensis NBRC 100605]
MNDVVEYRKLFIGGDWVTPTGTGTLDVISPHSEERVGRVPAATVEDVDRAVAAARAAFDTGPWPLMPLAERIGVVTRIKEGIAARAGDFAELISRQNGAPMSSAVRTQVLGAVAAYGSACTTAAEFGWEQERPGVTGPMVVRHEPVGVVAAVVPWNVPQLVIAAKLAPALLAGCTVVLKPAPETPLDANLLAEVCTEAGLPRGVLSVLPADRDVSGHLVAHPEVDKVAFTGSVLAGKQIMAAAAENLTRVTLELGGKSAAILLEDADLDTAIPHVVAGAFVNSGQACVALTRILVPAARYDEVADTLAAAIAALRVGDPSDPATVIGPMVSARQRQRNLDYIRLGQEEGAKILTGGGVPAGLSSGWYVEPTLLGNVDNSMRVAREEIFGPVVCLIAFEDEDDAVRIANDSDLGLSGAVWAGDVQHGLDVARRVRTGTFSVNCQRFDVAGPFGGYKNSGLGREFGPEGLAAYLETKSIFLPAQ